MERARQMLTAPVTLGIALRNARIHTLYVLCNGSVCFFRFREADFSANDFVVIP